MSESQKQTLNIWYDVFLHNCHEFWGMHYYYCCYEQIDLCFVSQGRVRTAVRRGGQFCCSLVTNLLQYLYAKNYRTIVWFDKVIVNKKGAIFFCPTVYMLNFQTVSHSQLIRVTEASLHQLKCCLHCVENWVGKNLDSSGAAWHHLTPGSAAVHTDLSCD